MVTINDIAALATDRNTKDIKFLMTTDDKKGVSDYVDQIIAIAKNNPCIIDTNIIITPPFFMGGFNNGYEELVRYIGPKKNPKKEYLFLKEHIRTYYSSLKNVFTDPNISTQIIGSSEIIKEAKLEYIDHIIDYLAAEHEAKVKGVLSVKFRLKTIFEGTHKIRKKACSIKKKEFIPRLPISKNHNQLINLMREKRHGMEEIIKQIVPEDITQYANYAFFEEEFKKAYFKIPGIQRKKSGDYVIMAHAACKALTNNVPTKIITHDTHFYELIPYLDQSFYQSLRQLIIEKTSFTPNTLLKIYYAEGRGTRNYSKFVLRGMIDINKHYSPDIDEMKINPIM